MKFTASTVRAIATPEEIHSQGVSMRTDGD